MDAIKPYSLKPAERLLFLHIVEVAGWQGGWCEQTAQELSDQTQISKRSLWYAINALRQGFILESLEQAGFATKLRPNPVKQWLSPEKFKVVQERVYPKPKQAPSQQPRSNLILFPMNNPHTLLDQPPAPEISDDPFQHPASVIAAELLSQGLRRPYNLSIFAADQIKAMIKPDAPSLMLWREIITEFFMREATPQNFIKKPNIQIFISTYQRRIEDFINVYKREHDAVSNPAPSLGRVPATSNGSHQQDAGQSASRTSTPQRLWGVAG